MKKFVKVEDFTVRCSSEGFIDVTAWLEGMKNYFSVDEEELKFALALYWNLTEDQSLDDSEIFKKLGYEDN